MARPASEDVARLRAPDTLIRVKLVRVRILSIVIRAGQSVWQQHRRERKGRRNSNQS